MGLGVKLNFAFIAVILSMVLTQAGFSLFMEYSRVKDLPRKTVDAALQTIFSEISILYRANTDLGAAIDKDPAFRQAFVSRNRAAAAQAIKSVVDRYGFPGYITVILEDGQVFYSSDSPSKFGYRTDLANKPAVSMALGGRVVNCASAPSTTKTLSLSTMCPLHSGFGIGGAIVVSLPADGALLAGIQTKAKLANNDHKDFELALYSMKDSAVIASTASLGNPKDSQYLTALNQQGEKIIRGEELDFKGRLWKPTPLFAPDGKHAAGLIYASAAIPDPNPKTFALLSQMGIGTGIALLLSILFSAGLSRRLDASMRFMKQRVKDLAANKPELSSLDGLSGEWLELAEMMDTAISSSRSSNTDLRQQGSQYEEVLNEKQRQIESMNVQLENVNRQLAAHNRQTSEVSKQIGSANMQAITLQHKLGAVLQVSTEGFLILDPFGSVLSANPTFVNWMGVSEREIAGRHCFDLVKKPGESRDSHNQQTPAKPAGTAGDLINLFFPEGLVYHRYNEKIVEVLIHLQPVMVDDANVEGYIMVMRDKSVHSELGRLRAEIVDMLTNAIRTPLALAEPKWANILGTRAEKANPSLVKILVELHQTYQQLLGVVDSYLMMYGGFVPVDMAPREQVAITRLVGECLEQLASQARTHQIMLDYKTVTGLPTTAINKDIVRDVITQLLEKLISVTAPGGRVRAETISREQEIRLTISSSGPALPQEEIEEMFVGFIDGKHSDDTYQSRLSLYLSRNNAERLGGRVWAESEAGRGTSIFFTLPIH